MHKKRKFGFSIAEALMALLVVSLITIAAIPVITKKKRDSSQSVHGEWVCYLNNAGQHVTKMTANGKTTTSTGSSCTFAPPGRAQNFSVKVVGGGGGGAAGRKPTPKIYTYSTSFRPDENGDYNVIVVGGGGAGGGDRPNDGYCGAGGSGGWDIMDVALRTDKTCSITIGKGGRCQSCDGETTIFSCNGYTVKATGGHGGNSREKHPSDSSWSDPGDDHYNTGEGGLPNGVNGGNCGHGDYSCVGKITDKRVTNYLSSSYGRGAPCQYYSGSSGAINIIRKNTSGGGAGSPGASVVKTFPKLNVVRVTIGRGGTGGKSNGANGTQGGTTSFGNIVTALGGNAGEADFTTGSATASKGENATTPSITNVNDIQRSFGGLTENNSSVNATAAGGYSYNGIDGAGSGGAGGGATWSNTGGSFGQGADGRSGLVVVRW